MKEAWYNKKWVRVLLHTAAWIILFSLPELLQPPDDHLHKNTGILEELFNTFSIITHAYLILVFYANANFLLPTLFYKKNYRLYILVHIVLMLGLLLLSNGLFILLQNPPFSVWRHPNFMVVFPYVLIVVSGIAYRMISDKMKSEHLIQEKETENLKTELALLRSQISPHFMFNVLNNMVAMARLQSDQLEPSLIKLSSLMRYMLYETNEEKVPLEKELDYLQNYIDLQKQRFKSSVKVLVSLPEVEPFLQIEPMLLIPFVENAFKHGTGLIEHARIEINLHTDGNVLQFSVRNKYNPQSTEIKDKTSGIGLANAQRRLNLLYGNSHQLLINKNSDWFEVTLHLNL